MNKTYVWRRGDVEVHNGNMTIAIAKALGIFGCHVVDTEEENPLFRYGTFEGHQNQCSWLHCPIEDFPKEFRVHLLLLGVS